MSSYFWLTSPDSVSRKDLANMIEQVKKVWVIPSDQAMKISVDYVKASLFDLKK